MKVIKKVDPVETFNMQIGCGHCGSQLEIDAGDLRKQPGEGDQRDWTPAYFYVSCPVCHEQTKIDDVRIPHLVQKRVPATPRGGYFDR